MRNKTLNIFYILFGLITIIVIIFFTIKSLNYLSKNVTKIDPNIFVAIIAGNFTILGFFITRYLERKKAIDFQIREQKLPVYEEFVSFLFEIFTKTKEDKSISKEKIVKFYWEMNKKSILWLSDKTLKSYSIWKNEMIEYADKKDENKLDNIKCLLLLENLLFDFRKDIGHKNNDLKKGDILKVFINNFKL